VRPRPTRSHGVCMPSRRQDPRLLQRRIPGVSSCPQLCILHGYLVSPGVATSLSFYTGLALNSKYPPVYYKEFSIVEGGVLTG